jgi:hypothetical protein
VSDLAAGPLPASDGKSDDGEVTAAGEVEVVSDDRSVGASDASGDFKGGLGLT